MILKVDGTFDGVAVVLLGDGAPSWL